MIRTGHERRVVEAGRQFLRVHYAVCERLTCCLCRTEVLVASWLRPPALACGMGIEVGGNRGAGTIGLGLGLGHSHDMCGIYYICRTTVS